jgi:hypothetical protein
MLALSALSQPHFYPIKPCSLSIVQTVQWLSPLCEQLETALISNGRLVFNVNSAVMVLQY